MQTFEYVRERLHNRCAGPAEAAKITHTKSPDHWAAREGNVMKRGARLRHALLFAMAATLAMPAGAFAADLGVEVSAAQITARSGSRNIRDIEAIHERMQAAINCLVGPKGADF